MKDKLILSLFPGVDLFGRAFAAAGFCVVRGPDLILCDDIRDFHPAAGKFDGIIGGPPCQDFSGLKRIKTGYGLEMLKEFQRVIKEARPNWWLMENVSSVPDCKIDGFGWQRFELHLSWYRDCTRLRHFQFGHKLDMQIDVEKKRPVGADSYHPTVTANDRRSFEAMCELQGLSAPLELPDFNLAGKKKLIGNGVPMELGHAIAMAIKEQIYGSADAKSYLDLFGGDVRRCKCECGRRVYGKALYHSSTCRSKARRRRAALAHLDEEELDFEFNCWQENFEIEQNISTEWEMDGQDGEI